MKWFQHFSDARYDTKVARLLKKHNLKGYGLYFLTIEFISSQLLPEKPIPDLEETIEDIAEFTGEDPEYIKEIYDYCIEQQLFEYNERLKRITCLKLLHHLDNTMSQNPEIKKILNNFKKLQETCSDLKQIRLDHITLDKNKDINSKNEKIENLLEYWNLLKIRTHNIDVVLKYISKRHIENIEFWGIEKIKEAMGLYKEVLDKSNFFHYKWSFWDFIGRKNSIPNFVPEADPIGNFCDKDKVAVDKYLKEKGINK